MLALLFILGVLCPLTFAEIPISLLNPNTDGVLASTFPNSFLLQMPDCSIYGNQSVLLLYTEAPTNLNNTVNFTVQPCPVSQSWYLLGNLKNGTTYSMSYKIGNDTSSVLTNTTTNVNDYQQIDTGLRARSGAMVVITVILSLAMVFLLVGIILVFFFFSG
nr:uroplakin 2-like isoform X1 [Danio rerio]|eukprot:XP_005172061.1 uroplakin 2-like isoform X1 [Danio rerio]